MLQSNVRSYLADLIVTRSQAILRPSGSSRLETPTKVIERRASRGGTPDSPLVCQQANAVDSLMCPHHTSSNQERIVAIFHHANRVFHCQDPIMRRCPMYLRVSQRSVIKMYDVWLRIPEFPPSVSQMNASDPGRLSTSIMRHPACGMAQSRELVSACHRNNAIWIVGNLFALSFPKCQA
jgi:hypothetical protein